MPNYKERKQYNYTSWCKYLKNSKGKDLEYNEDYYKYLRGMTVIRELENYEQYFMDAYDWVVFDMKGVE